MIEFNVRFGDPEACVLVPLVDAPWGELLHEAARGSLPAAIPTARGACLALVLASEGYPGKPAVGDRIEGLDAVPSEAFAYQAGTKREGDGIVTSGGRVVTVGARADTLAEARARAYAAAAGIRFRGMHFRTDIGARGLQRRS